jgi:hypothetical protein
MSVHRRLALVTIAALLAAACSDRGASGPTPTTPPPTESSTTLPATRATTSSTTALPATAPTTTAPTPSTTTLDDVKKAVIAGYDKGYQAYNAALGDPDHFDPATIRASYAAGIARENVVKSIDDFRRQGFRTKPGPHGLQYYVVEGITLGDGPPVTQAELTVCDVSDTVVYDPRDPNNPNDDAIVNNLLETYRWRWTMVVEDGVWKRLTSDQLDYQTGVNACPPKPSS